MVWLNRFLRTATNARAAMALLVAFVEATYTCHHQKNHAEDARGETPLKSRVHFLLRNMRRMLDGIMRLPGNIMSFGSSPRTSGKEAACVSGRAWGPFWKWLAAVFLATRALPNSPLWTREGRREGTPTGSLWMQWAWGNPLRPMTASPTSDRWARPQENRQHPKGQRRRRTDR